MEQPKDPIDQTQPDKSKTEWEAHHDSVAAELKNYKSRHYAGKTILDQGDICSD